MTPDSSPAPESADPEPQPGPTADVADPESRQAERSALRAEPETATEDATAPRGFDADEARHYEATRGHGFTLPGERARWTSDVELILARIEDQLPTSPQVLDIGCGTGKFTRVVHDVLAGPLNRTPRIHGVDASDAMLEIAASLDAGQIHYSPADARRLSLPDRYDLVTSCQVLDSFENPVEVLAHWQGLVTPGGHLLTVLAFSRPEGWTNRSEDQLARMPLARVTSTEPLAEAVVAAGYRPLAAGFLPSVSPLYGGAADGHTGPVGSRYYLLAAAPR